MTFISSRRLVAAALLAWGLFGGVAVLAARRGGAPFDAPVLQSLHRRTTPALDRLAIFLTSTGNTGPMIAAGVLATGLLHASQPRAARLFAAGVGGSMLLTQVLKRLAARPRPALWVSLRPEHTFSFPSGHAMDTAALAAALYFGRPPYRQAGALAALFALGVGWARMHLGVHFPSDVLAGWSAGAGWVLLVQLWARRPQPRLIAARPA